jgi:hypothetical protein
LNASAAQFSPTNLAATRTAVLHNRLFYIFAFYLCIFSHHVSPAVNKPFFQLCKKELTTRQAAADPDPAAPMLSCTFPPRMPNTTTCTGVCAAGYVTSGMFLCRQRPSGNVSFAGSSAALACIPVANASSGTSGTGGDTSSSTKSSQSKSSVGPAAAAGLGVAFGVVAIVMAAVWAWRRRRTSRSKAVNMQLGGLVVEAARTAFLREYGHSVKDHKAFAFSFGQMQLPRKRVQLLRELGQRNNEVVVEGLLLPEKQAVAVRWSQDSDTDRQSAILREAMVLHLFRHDNILALLHVCRFAPSSSSSSVVFL